MAEMAMAQMAGAAKARGPALGTSRSPMMVQHHVRPSCMLRKVFDEFLGHVHLRVFNVR